MNKTLAVLAGLGIVSSCAAEPVLLRPEILWLDSSTNSAVLSPETTGEYGVSSVLTETVRLSFSKSVYAEIGFDPYTNVVALATCHPNGKKTSNGNISIPVALSSGGKIVISTDASDCNIGQPFMAAQKIALENSLAY